MTLPIRDRAAADLWRVVHETGTADHLHHLPDPVIASRAVRILHPTAPAIVLGSSQSESIIDAESAASLGFSVARRRSGGGAVLIVPGEQVWVDLLIPKGDPLWNDDIVEAAAWVGAAWSRALVKVGVVDSAVHNGRLISNDWSNLICFAGLGPGEVTVGGSKVMGLSQRRSRDWTRIQSAVHISWRPEALVESLALEPERRAECLSAVRRSVFAVDSSERTLTRSFLSSLPD